MRTVRSNITSSSRLFTYIYVFPLGRKFAGSSAMFSMRRDVGKPKLVDAMGREEEGVRVWNVCV